MASETSKDKENLEGIGGWLILLAIGVVLGPLFTVSAFADFEPGNFYQIIRRGDFVGNSYFLLIASVVLMLLLQSYTAFLFFTKASTFPKFQIGVLAGNVVVSFFDHAFLAAIGVAQDEAVRGIFGTIMAAAVWIPYLLRSKRVKATFVNKKQNSRSPGRGYDLEECEMYAQILDQRSRELLEKKVAAHIATNSQDFSIEAFRPTEEEVAAMNLPPQPKGFSQYKKDKKERIETAPSIQPVGEENNEISQPASLTNDPVTSLDSSAPDTDAQKIADLQAEIDRLKVEVKTPNPDSNPKEEAVKPQSSFTNSSKVIIATVMGLIILAGGLFVVNKDLSERRNPKENNPSAPSFSYTPFTCLRDASLSGKNLEIYRANKVVWCYLSKEKSVRQSTSRICWDQGGVFFESSSAALSCFD